MSVLPGAARFASVFAALCCVLVASGCKAQTSSGVPEAESSLLSAREAFELQQSTRFDVAHVINAGDMRYAVPSAPFVRLSEVGRGTTTPYFQAWLELMAKPADRDFVATHFPSANTVTASVTFSDPGQLRFPERDDGWVKSDVGLPDFPGVDLWLDTEACEDDQPPVPTPEFTLQTIQAVWQIAETRLYLRCSSDFRPTPNGRRAVSCTGGSGPEPSGVTYGFYAGDRLDQGCRAALERLAASFAHLPLIVADWRTD